jgi:hypothetical protein
MHMPELDGTATHKDFVTPFDAHDKVLRDSGDYEYQEYPKAIAHNEDNTEPVVAYDRKHEAELLG